MPTFFTSESGATTVDWVVLCAAVVGLGVGSAASVRSGAISLGADIQGSLSDASMTELGQLGTDALTARLLSYSDNFVRLHYHWWEARRDVYGDEETDRQQEAALAELRRRGLLLDAPDGATRCDDLGSLRCWNDATRVY